MLQNGNYDFFRVEKREEEKKRDKCSREHRLEKEIKSIPSVSIQNSNIQSDPQTFFYASLMVTFLPSFKRSVSRYIKFQDIYNKAMQHGNS